tara:strand:- start:4000 stop:7398 length:3399 start_codon:yes stop_codon:yes gene_type:complete
MPIFNPKRIFELSGSNTSFVKNVFFGEARVEDIVYKSTTGLSGVVPAEAVTDNILIETNEGIIDLGPQNIVLDSLSQVSVSGLDPNNVSGEAGSLVTISGENFYSITDVNFGTGIGRASEFNVVSDKIIEAIVPTGAEYDEVTVFSSIRTGAAGAISFASGDSNNKFVPIPTVTGINSQRIRGSKNFILGGFGATSVTGVTVNNINFSTGAGQPAAVNHVGTGVQFTVPTGEYTKGAPTLLLQSGVQKTLAADFSISPDISIAGVTPGVFLGSTATISGLNFHSGLLYTGESSTANPTGCLVSIGGETGNFEIISNAGGYNRLQGNIPSGIPIAISGGNVAAGAVGDIRHLEVTVYSKDYPNQYVATGSFRPGIQSPTVNSVSPPSGVGGTDVVIEGTNLYGITGVAFNGIGNVGVGTQFTFSQVSEVDPGFKIKTSVPIQANIASTGGFLGLDVSGFFGNVGIQDAFFVFGSPDVNSVIPSTDITPGSTGSVYGSGLYSGSEVLLYGGAGTVASSNFRQNLLVTGYANDNQINFVYPNSFDTGENYKIRVRNQKSSQALFSITGVRKPLISGVSVSGAFPAALSGEEGGPVTISGFFEKILDSGIKIGDRVVETYALDNRADYTYPNVTIATGIRFNIPNNVTSDFISVQTSGGFAEFGEILNVSKAAPLAQGFYTGYGITTPSFYNSSEQAFRELENVTITGERLNLVTGISFSGLGNESFDYSDFIEKTPSTLSFKIPTGIRPESGNFILKDFKGRQADSPFSLNLVNISGASSDTALPGESINISGKNVTGLDFVFPDLTGGTVVVQGVDATSGAFDVVSVRIPSGVVPGELSLTGRRNDNAANILSFIPTPLVTGVVGFGTTNSVATGNEITVTGVNFNGTASGDTFSQYVGISGTGNANSQEEAHFYPVSGFSTGVGIGTETNLLYSSLTFSLDNSYIGTGRFFIVSEPYTSETFNTGIAAYTGYSAAISQPYFSQEFIIEGTRVNVTGYGPSRGVTGANIEFTGFGLNEVTGTFLQPTSGEIVEADFTVNSANKITLNIPREAVDIRGTADVLFSGGTNQVVGPLEVILDASVVEYNIVEQDDTPSSSTRVGNFTQKETVNGTVFLVTRTRFPDGTTAIVSSTPQ